MLRLERSMSLVVASRFPVDLRGPIRTRPVRVHHRCRGVHYGLGWHVKSEARNRKLATQATIPGPFASPAIAHPTPPERGPASQGSKVASEKRPQGAGLQVQDSKSRTARLANH